MGYIRIEKAGIPAGLLIILSFVICGGALKFRNSFNSAVQEHQFLYAAAAHSMENRRKTLHSEHR